MKKTLLIFWLVGISSSVAAHPTRKSCEKLPSEYVISGPMSIAEIERDEMLKISEMSKVRADIPQLPFGFENAAWVALKSRMRPVDNMVAYSTDRRSWQNLAGESGYALLRSGCVVVKHLGFHN